MVAGHAISRPRIHLTRMDLTDHQGQLQADSAIQQVTNIFEASRSLIVYRTRILLHRFYEEPFCEKIVTGCVLQTT
jgi:hypothetical protein